MLLLIALLVAVGIGIAITWLRVRRERATYEDIDGYWEALQRVAEDAPLGSSRSGNSISSIERDRRPGPPDSES
jgi:hypothetical protein